MITEDEVRRLSLALPGAYEQTSYGGRPSWRTAPRMFAWLRDDPEALVVWVDAIEDKEALIAADPSKFFTTPHYNGQPIVLVRLEAVDATEAAELIVDSWLLRAPKSLTHPVDRRRLTSTVMRPSRDDHRRRTCEGDGTREQPG